MNHVDEGMIHGWLDGALSAAQSAEIDAHVKGCAECSAKVAEARGLIAASSRILVALDDTPANVIPKKAPVAPARRRWNVTPWVSGLAAAAVVVMLWRTGGVEQPTPMAEIGIPTIPPVRVPEPSLGPLSQPAPPPPRVAVAPDTARRAMQRKVGNAAGAGASGGTATRVGAADVATAQIAAAPAAPVAAAEESQRRESFVDTEHRARSDSLAIAASRALRSAPLTSVVADQAFAVENPVKLAGCYRMPVVNRSSDIVTTAVGSAAKAARSAAGAPAPSAQVARSETPTASTLLRLDTITSGQGFAIRDAQTGSARGVWQVLNKDSARVTIPVVGTFTLAVFDKVACPER